MHIQRHSQLLRHRRERTTPAAPAHPLGTPYPSLREKEKTRLAMCWCAGGWMDGDGAGERESERDSRKAGGRGGVVETAKKREGGVLSRSPSYFRVAFCPRYIGG